MPTLDWIFAGVLFVSLALGAWRGLVYEVLLIVSWLAAFALAQLFASDVATKLPMAGASDAIRYAAAFTLIFVLSVFTCGLLAKLVKKLFSSVGLQPIDRVLGAVFGLLRGGMVLLVATALVGMTPFKKAQWWQESVGAGITLTALRGLKPVLPEDFRRYLP